MTDLTHHPIALRPGEGRVIPGPEGITVKVSGGDTGGSIAVLEATSPPGFAAPAHVHHDCDELFYVLTGTFRCMVGERTVDLPAGSFLFVPRGTVHAPAVAGEEPGTVLITFVPGGAERAFDEFAQLAAQVGGPPDPGDERLHAIARKYGATFVGAGD